MAAQTPAAANQHCVVAAGDPTIHCCKTFGEALYAATGGAVNIQANNGNDVSAATLEKALNATPMATYVQAIGYTGTGRGGSSLDFTNTAICSGTTGGGVWTYFQPPWDNNFESVQMFSGCKGRMYDPPTASGSPSYTFAPDAYYSTSGRSTTSGRRCVPAGRAFPAPELFPPVLGGAPPRTGGLIRDRPDSSTKGRRRRQRRLYADRGARSASPVGPGAFRTTRGGCWFRSFCCGRDLICRVVAQHREDDVAAASREADQRSGVAVDFRSFAVVVGAAGRIGSQAGERG